MPLRPDHVSTLDLICVYRFHWEMQEAISSRPPETILVSYLPRAKRVKDFSLL